MRQFVSYLAFLLIAGTAISATPLEEKMREATTEMESLWAEEACETVIIKKKGFPLASVACSGSFDNAQRAKLLDILFRHHFVLEKETYRLKPRNGTYLYKAALGSRTVYFKLYVRDADDLWPRNPVRGKQVAVHVQNLRSARDLVRWRTLGIPLTFAVTYGRSDTAELLEKLEEYNEEKWLAIPLEDDRVDIADGNLLTIGDALDPEKLAEYLAALEETEGVDGISPLYCSRFCKNVPALRALLAAVRGNNGERALTLVDTDSSAVSSFYETGRIMGFRTFRAFVTRPEKNNFCSVLRQFLDAPEANASRVIAVDAADETAFRCLREITSAAAATVEFVRVSRMSLTNPFR
ncbi:MAG: divergent polysaccharide deacetylase family protein [Spirochaetota bacterium]